jgi:hypoxanthine phosphoribosyltransferase
VDISSICVAIAAWVAPLISYIFQIIGLGYVVWKLRSRIQSTLSPKRIELTFNELLYHCDEMRVAVQAFQPDVMLCFDGRCAIWAEVLLDWLTHRPAIVVGDRIRNDGQQYLRPDGSTYDEIAIGHWKLYFPREILAEVQPDKDRVLIVSDYVSTGDQFIAAISYLNRSGVKSAHIRTLGLAVRSEAHRPDIGLLERVADKRVVFVDDYIWTGSTQQSFVDYAVGQKMPREHIRTLGLFVLATASAKPDFAGKVVGKLMLPYMRLR